MSSFVPVSQDLTLCYGRGCCYGRNTCILGIGGRTIDGRRKDVELSEHQPGD